MRLDGKKFLASTRTSVWQMVNDDAVLQQCIPGCESITNQPGGSSKMIVAASVGPVRARFSCTLEKTVLAEGESFLIKGQGNGGIAGHGKASVQMTLEEVVGGVELSYSSESSVGGKLAQVGSRLVQAAAEKFIRDFFAKFETLLPLTAKQAGKEPEAGTVEAAPPSLHAIERPSSTRSAGPSTGVLYRIASALGMTGRRSQHTAFEARISIIELSSRYTVLLDQKDFAGVCALFTEHATLAIGGSQARGKAEILQLLLSRPSNPSVHLSSAPMIDFINDREARAMSSVAVFRTPTAAEAQAGNSQGTRAIATYRDTLKRHDGEWLFESREAHAFTTI